MGRPIKVYDKTQKKVIPLYYPIGEVTDDERTPARIKDKNGNVFALLNTGTPPLTQKSIVVPKDKAGNSNITGTFTVPAGVTRLYVALCPARIWYETYWDDDGEHDFLNYKFHLGTDTTFGNLSAQKNGKHSFKFGCKKDYSFTKRTSYNSSTSGFYSCTDGSAYSNLTDEDYNDFNNKYYVGYIDVTPNQKIKYSVCGKSGKSNMSNTCGFILISYGKGIEK